MKLIFAIILASVGAFLFGAGMAALLDQRLFLGTLMCLGSGPLIAEGIRLFKGAA